MMELSNNRNLQNHLSFAKNWIFGIVCSKFLFGSKPIKNINMKLSFNDIDHDLTCAGVLLRDHGSDAVQDLDVEVRGALEANPDVAGDNVYTELTFCNT